MRWNEALVCAADFQCRVLPKPVVEGVLNKQNALRYCNDAQVNAAGFQC